LLSMPDNQLYSLNVFIIDGVL